jgi:1-acyl-sn-glycerol-3-phosphate acyltransferase
MIIKIIRSLCFTLIFFSTALIASTLCLLTYPLSYEKRYPIIALWPKFITQLARYLCQINYTIEGIENIPSGNSIIVSNHQSTWETLAFFQLFPHACFVLKKELLSLPIFGWCLRLLEPIAIDRKQGYSALEQLIEQGKERLAANRSIIIFPEGHRMPVEKLGKFKIGAAHLAIQTKTPIIPVSIDAGKYWGRHLFIKESGTVRVMIGKPMDCSGLTAAELTEKVKKQIAMQLESA